MSAAPFADRQRKNPDCAPDARQALAGIRDDRPACLVERRALSSAWRRRDRCEPVNRPKRLTVTSHCVASVQPFKKRGNTMRIPGTEGYDTLTGTAAADEILGFGGDDILTGAGGADRLDGGTGSD